MANADADREFMAEAITLSQRHLGQTATNPSVGCVIVSDGVVVGRGVTAVGGRPHAEPQALADAGDAARGATAYVTLEPCSHFGKTPPCANALIEAGVGRVVISVTDPDERVSGRGIGMLRDAGILVETGLLEAEGRRSLAGYLTRQTRHRPYVTLKLAISADGMIGRKGEGQVRITGDEARHEVQDLRAVTDAILIGIGTALADDPELTCRLPGLEDRSPIRIVLDRRLELPLSSKLVRTARDVPVIVVTEKTTEDQFRRTAVETALKDAGVEVLDADDLPNLLFALASRGISSLLVEGGATVARRFLDAGLVDRILLYHGPDTVGADGLETPIDSADMPEAFTLFQSRSVGSDRLEIFERGF